ncbi:MAG: CPBP family intramembrane metalloprotease [Lachnospiraceae bacterium]|nr:CPBP family intramembrane metalloprotease [Lachnospiraceae bacterium]
MTDDKALRRYFSVLGFCLVLYVVVSNITGSFFLIGVMVVRLLRHPELLHGTPQALLGLISGDPMLTLVVNTLAVYVISMPLIAYVIKKCLPRLPEQPQEAVTAEALPLPYILMLAPVVLFLMEAGNLISLSLAGLAGRITGLDPANTAVDSLISGEWWQTLLFVVILGPAAEELFFRKFLMDRVSPLGRHAAVMVSSITFALFHQNLYQFFYAFFIGIVFAMVYVRTGRILYSILIHMAVNLYGGMIRPWALEGLLDLDEQALLQGGEAAVQALAGHAGPVIFLLCEGIVALTGFICLIVFLVRGVCRLPRQVSDIPDTMLHRDFLTAPGMITFAVVCIGMGFVMIFARVV